MRRIVVIAAVTAVVIVVALLGIKTVEFPPPETPVLIDYGIGMYATAACVENGTVANRFVENPEDATDRSKQLVMRPEVELVTLDTARNFVHDTMPDGGPDPDCQDAGGFDGQQESLLFSLLGW